MKKMFKGNPAFDMWKFFAVIGWVVAVMVVVATAVASKSGGVWFANLKEVWLPAALLVIVVVGYVGLSREFAANHPKSLGVILAVIVATLLVWLALTPATFEMVNKSNLGYTLGLVVIVVLTVLIGVVIAKRGKSNQS